MCVKIATPERLICEYVDSVGRKIDRVCRSVGRETQLTTMLCVEVKGIVCDFNKGSDLIKMTKQVIYDHINDMEDICKKMFVDQIAKIALMVSQMGTMISSSDLQLLRSFRAWIIAMLKIYREHMEIIFNQFYELINIKLLPKAFEASI